MEYKINSYHTNNKPNRKNEKRKPIHEIDNTQGAILAQGDVKRSVDENRIIVTNPRENNITKSPQQLKLYVNNKSELVLPREPTEPSQIKKNISPTKKLPIVQSEPVRCQLANITERRKLMEKYTIKHRTHLDANVVNANTLVKNPTPDNGSPVKTAEKSDAGVGPKSDNTNGNMPIVPTGENKRVHKKKGKYLDDVRTAIENISTGSCENTIYESASSETTKTTVKHVVSSIKEKSKFKGKSYGLDSRRYDNNKKYTSPVRCGDRNGKRRENEKLLITLRPSSANTFTSSESDTVQYETPNQNQKPREKTLSPKTIYKQPTVMVKEIKRIHQDLLKRNNLMIAQMQKEKAEEFKIASLNDRKKKRQRKFRKPERYPSPHLKSGTVSPAETEVAKWLPCSIDNHTKPYYEAWVNTTLAAISKNCDKTDLNKQKKSIIESFQRTLNDYDNMDEEILTPNVHDERFTGRIKFKVKR